MINESVGDFWLSGMAHSNVIRGDAADLRAQVRDDITPEIRWSWVSMEKENHSRCFWGRFSGINICHVWLKNILSMEGERKLWRDAFCGLRHFKVNGTFEVYEGEEILKLLTLVTDETSFSEGEAVFLIDDFD
jgi:hypothetical protein